MRIVTVLVLLSLSASVAAQAYRWVDENGVTHYSDTPPPTTETQHSVEERKVDKSANQRVRRQASSDRRRGQTDDQLDCASAIRNIRAGVSDFMAMGQEERRQGQLTDEEYERVRADVIKLDNLVSAPQCRRSSGADRLFYACMEEGGDAISLGICIMMTSPTLVE